MRRFTPSIKRGLAHRRLSRGRGRHRPNLWVEYIDLVTSESEESTKKEEQQGSEPKEANSGNQSIESDPSEDEPNKGDEKTPSSPSYSPLNHIATEKTQESNNKAEDRSEEATSKYVPIKYPIFPPLRVGPEEPEEKCYWSLMGSSRGLVLTAPDPKPTPDEERPMIQLKGEDTELPGSPGYLPMEISAADYWEEMTRGNKSFNPYKYLLDYAEASAPFRVPIDETKSKDRDDRTPDEKVGWYRKPYGFTKQP